ncbi:MAG: hypothetical protein HY817_04540 [Candidatus Abawacabacteria bacterium]|nr:hypothetical protein [Candidatus Abawacabacteria bacterium]
MPKKAAAPNYERRENNLLVAQFGGPRPQELTSRNQLTKHIRALVGNAISPEVIRTEAAIRRAIDKTLTEVRIDADTTKNVKALPKGIARMAVIELVHAGLVTDTVLTQPRIHFENNMEGSLAAVLHIRSGIYSHYRGQIIELLDPEQSFAHQRLLEEAIEALKADWGKMRTEIVAKDNYRIATTYLARPHNNDILPQFVIDIPQQLRAVIDSFYSLLTLWIHLKGLCRDRSIGPAVQHVVSAFAGPISRAHTQIKRRVLSYDFSDERTTLQALKVFHTEINDLLIAIRRHLEGFLGIDAEDPVTYVNFSNDQRANKKITTLKTDHQTSYQKRKTDIEIEIAALISQVETGSIEKTLLYRQLAAWTPGMNDELATVLADTLKIDDGQRETFRLGIIKALAPRPKNRTTA